jgi:urea transport system substrate-binding protein
MWKRFTKNKDETTDDPIEATLVGFEMWTHAVAQAGTTDSMQFAKPCTAAGVPSRFEEFMNTNHHLSRPA